MLERLDLSQAVDIYPPLSLTPDYLKRLKDATSMKLLVKGIVTSEDTALALQQGVDGIIVSNHGGRADESGRSTIESLPEAIEAAAGRVPVLVDGGLRRGTDILKAMALGASAICIGRPYLWGLAAFGQPGVEAVLDILRRELQIILRQVGMATLAGITGTHVVDRAR
jgi:isopentenyl diphosphate isomerase/L-lactate dehydrogenase-like FMN-dependent dehydrogenase